MALPHLSASRSMRRESAPRSGSASPGERGLVPAAPYDVLACTKPLNAGLRHCYLRVLDQAPGGASFSLSFAPGGSSPEYELHKPGTRCTHAATLDAGQLHSLTTAWNQSVAADPNYRLLGNNCCTKVIGALNRIGVSAPADINAANWGYH